MSQSLKSQKGVDRSAKQVRTVGPYMKLRLLMQKSRTLFSPNDDDHTAPIVHAKQTSDPQLLSLSLTLKYLPKSEKFS